MIHAKRWNLTTTATCSLAMTFSLTPHWWSTWWVSDLTVQNFTEENHHKYHQYEVAKNQSEILSLLKISVKWRGWIFLCILLSTQSSRYLKKQQFCRQTNVNSCFSCSFSLPFLLLLFLDRPTILLHCKILIWRVLISEINRSPSMNAKPFSIER